MDGSVRGSGCMPAGSGSLQTTAKVKFRGRQIGWLVKFLEGLMKGFTVRKLLIDGI